VTRTLQITGDSRQKPLSQNTTQNVVYQEG
jgi:hypothetical protein